MQMNRRFLFTVDQLELIRRLRNSGLTKEQVLCAFDSFECLDNQVSKSLNIPMTLQALQIQTLQRLALTVPATVALGNSNPTQLQDSRTQQQLQLQQQQLSHLQSQQQKQVVSLQHQQLLHKLTAAAAAAAVVSQGRPVQVASQPLPPPPPQQDEGLVPAKSSSDSGTVTDNSNNSEDVLSNSGGRLQNGNEDGEIDSEEMRDFFGQGEIACLEEIKDFILKHNIKQQQIAVLAGVSQPYVSRYLRGDFNSMSDRSCCAIKKWYLTYRKNPMAIGAAVSTALMMNSGANGTPAPTVKKLISQASVDLTGLVSAPPNAADAEMFSCPRRERFVFRPNHLQILERFFVDDNYPSYDKREDIAKACNESTQALVGRELTEKEMVTVQIVSNWFANKRKDLKKLYKEEGLDASQVPLRSRGRPSHSFLDSPLIQSAVDLQMNGGRSLLDKPVAVASDGDELRPDEATSDDASALQFSVEIAAVNQAIMSLTGQKPIGVKTEKADISEYLVAGRLAQNSCISAGAAVAADMS